MPHLLPNPFNESLPMTSSELIAALDEHVRPAEVTSAADLASEEARIELAMQAGERRLVNKLSMVIQRARAETEGI